MSIIDLHKILRIRKVKTDHESTEIILYVPESEGVHLWDAVKDVTLKNVMRQICDELRRIQKIKDKDQRRKAQKAMYLKYHPDRNNSVFAEEAVQFLRRQITRLAQDLPLEDPEDDLESSPAPPSDPKCKDLFDSWNTTAKKHSKAWKREQGNIRREHGRSIWRFIWMYKQFGLHPTSLRTHFLTYHAGALQQGPLTSGLYGHAFRLESYYLQTSYPNRYTPPAVPSFKFYSGDAKQAESAAASIFEMMSHVIN